MAADSIRGDGLYMAHNSLMALVTDSGQLAHARQRFEDSPPSYRSPSSEGSTVSESPTPPSEIQRQRSRSERKFQLKSQYHKSHPASQFRSELVAERRRLREKMQKGIYCLPIGVELNLVAFETVKKHWIKQGIWNNKWIVRGGMPASLNKWKHEEPLEPEPEWETDPEGGRPSFLRHLREAGTPETRHLKSDEERQRIAEQQATREHEREASRPFYRFIEQVSRECKWLQEVSRLEGTHVADSPDINTKAYMVVKNAWIEMGLWYRKWSVLPGMSWKHEQPLEEFLRDEMGDEPVDDAAGQTANEAPPLRNIFGAAAPCQLEQPSAGNLPDAHENEGTENAVHPLVPQPDVPNATPPNGPPNVPSAQQPNGDADHTWSASNSRQSREDGHATSPQRRIRSASFPKPQAPLNPTLSSLGLGQVHPLKVSKASKAQKKNQVGSQRPGRPRRSERPVEVHELRNTSNLSEGSLERPHTPLRRSRRLEEARHPRGINAPASSLNGPARSKCPNPARSLSQDRAERRGVQKRRAQRK